MRVGYPYIVSGALTFRNVIKFTFPKDTRMLAEHGVAPFFGITWDQDINRGDPPENLIKVC